MTEEAKSMRETLLTIDKFQPEVGGESKPLEGQSFQLDISKAGELFLLVLYSLVKSYENSERISLPQWCRIFLYPKYPLSFIGHRLPVTNHKKRAS